MQPDNPSIDRRSAAIATPTVDGRRREARTVAALREELELRLGASPSIEARQTAEAILRDRLEIERLARKREESGLTVSEEEWLVRRENRLSRSLRRLERLAPLPPHREPTLAEQLIADRRARGREQAA